MLKLVYRQIFKTELKWVKTETGEIFYHKLIIFENTDRTRLLKQTTSG